MSRIRTVATLAALASVGALVAAGAPTAHADTVTTATPGFASTAGVVRLEHVNGPRVALYETPDSATPVQAVAIAVDGRCRITNLGEIGGLLDISVTGGKSDAVYLYDSGLGADIRSPGCKPENGRIAQGQSLVVGTGSALDGDFVSATLNVEGKGDAILGWTAFAADAVVGSGSDPLSGDADTGPDSGSSDNTLVEVAPVDGSGGAAAFDSLELTETSGGTNAGISLDNGGDSPDGAPSEFFLGEQQEYAVDCDDANTVVETGDGSIGSVTFERLPNGFNPDKDRTCFNVGVTVEIQPEESTENGEPRDIAFVDHTTTAADGTPQEVRALVTIQWRVPRYSDDGSLRSGDALDLELAREISYGDDLTDLQDVEWCGREEAPAEGYDPEPQHPEGHPWCLTADDRVTEGDVIVQTQTYHGMGDPRWR